MTYQYNISIKRMGMQGCPSPAKVSIKSKDIYFCRISEFTLADYNIKLEEIPEVGLLPAAFYNLVGLEKYDDRLYKVQIKTNGQKYSFYMMHPWSKLKETFEKNKVRLTKNNIVLGPDLHPIWPRTLQETPPYALIQMHKQQKQK